jgi:crotonobetainyl-CoA:carnitine CoA-transferase CaiB-like acyl-CoA transferase
VGRPEWLTDERFADARSRAVNARQLNSALDEIFATRPLDEWASIFAEEPELFWCPVNTIDDLLVDEQFYAAGGVVGVPDDAGGRTMLATPADFAGATPVPRGRAPRLGEHTREVLGQLGFDDSAIDALVADGLALVDGSASSTANEG